MTKKTTNQKKLDSSKEYALICRCVNTASDRAIENLALKMLELKKRLEVASNEQQN
jgi:hypothetical protein